ncbi:CocE/NonD family hydrolase [Nocardia sp. CDC159]|uniref:CocE/NonD family hydrolase n=1 Tax=Nocardia pulmonis TaxID=2951408 RepID=A0A9X2IWD2_9NOCA|nr:MULTISPECIES: CocE/NonD family hydrolase [Nocardia]MCM6773439.1 CocE/NonD family hydrolase [Nocardia pulmonis]MCM6786326.1 CocE/NonD family hydrolase [Nocardia sp. CDC159]
MVIRTLILRGLAGLLLVAGALTPVTAVAAPSVPHQWRQEFIDTADGLRLHADILRPAGLAEDVRTPVVLTVSPYRAHLAYLSNPRPQGGPSTENLQTEMFLQAGYTYVIVDLRGFGGSNGCPDFGGPGERADVATAVEWAARQPWSTGRVGLFGTSYEGWTGLMGLATKPQGLAAVAAFEPVVDPYSYLYMQGIAWKFSGKPVTESGVRPADFAGFEHLLISGTPAYPTDPAEYQANANRNPLECAQPYVSNIADHDGAAQFWRDRDLVDRLRGNTIPLFLGQGFLDYNTRAYRVFDVWNGLGPGEHRAWFGQWGHRTCHKDCGTPQFDTEVLAFFDRHVAGKDVAVPGPRITVNRFDGQWRGENAWPPADATRVSVGLRPGAYTDRGLLPGPDRELWSVSQPLPTDQHLAGIPTAALSLRGPADATVAVELYDIAPDGRATVITRGIAPVRETAEVRLLGQDWVVSAGHRIGFRITDVVDDVWSHTPVNARVEVTAARVELPLLTGVRDGDVTGAVTEAVGKWRAEKSGTVAPDVLDNAVVTISFPDRVAAR